MHRKQSHILDPFTCSILSSELLTRLMLYTVDLQRLLGSVLVLKLHEEFMGIGGFLYCYSLCLAHIL